MTTRVPAVALALASCLPVLALAAPAAALPRERTSMDADWRFEFGHATDPDKDFDASNSFPFNYFAKTGSAAGAAAASFDDRSWRELDLPHDWAVELPFDSRGSGSHGSKALGRNFPENSVGWYRKRFTVPASDVGRRISIEFDGVFRDSVVWINGHYLGREPSGYSSFAYNLSEYLIYGGENGIVVRIDASLEEGWFYEGAGIYRHVWLVKTGPLHVARYGTFVTAELKDAAADVTARVTVINEGADAVSFVVDQTIFDADGNKIAAAEPTSARLAPGEEGELAAVITVADPQLWSLETPTMHRLVNTISVDGAVVDRYETPCGIRSIRFDANKGFFLNGKHVQILGTDNHQDHAGVGVALPDALQEFRVARLKEFGCNAIRCSHNPPTPELLDACDRLGMLILDENRLMGVTDYHLDRLEQLVLRDRNHPSVILWSLGNEEWGIEGSDQGERIAITMQALVQRLDPTRRITVASSGNWGRGYSIPIDVMGFNYHTHGNTDDYHAQFPDKPSVGTEECASFSTRGVYVEDRDHQHLTAYDENKPEWGSLAHEGWQHYADRAYVAGYFIWTGFDYRGETTPFSWPAINSQFGILDTCGFRKDNSYYYQSWWADERVLHILPHWNWAGKEGQPIRVWAYSNCDEVELLLNGQSLGRKPIERNSHLEWIVDYAPGKLLARGFREDQEILSECVETAGEPVAVQLTPNRAQMTADGADAVVVTVRVVDAEARMAPIAENEITFQIEGPGRIIGVGNGDPSSHEADKYVEAMSTPPVAWKMRAVDGVEDRPEVAFDFDDSDWRDAFADGDGRGERRHGGNRESSSQPTVYRGALELTEITSQITATLLLRSVGDDQSVYFNGELVAQNVRRDEAGHELDFETTQLRAGKNIIAIVSMSSAERGRGRGQGGHGASNPAVLRIVRPRSAWKRSLFNGLAQVIVQSTGDAGEVILTANSPGVTAGRLVILASRPGGASADVASNASSSLSGDN